MKRSACLIFNPFAGQGDSVSELAAIQAALSPELALDIYTINSEEDDPVLLARRAIARGTEMIIASGGDGTISNVAEASISTGIPFGMIPRGTANAFAKALGIPLEIKAACETILTGQTRLVDAAFCNGKPMVLLAGVGFEAEAIEKADREAKNRFGKLAYIIAGVNQWWNNFKSFQVWIETEEETISLQASAVTIANVAPLTSVLAHGAEAVIADDGLLDITIVAPISRKNAVLAAYHLLKTGFIRTSTNREDIKYFRTSQIKIKTKPPQKVALDGNLIGNTPIEIECISKALTILVPAVS